MRNDSLFYESLIAAQVDAPRFVARPWLAEEIEGAMADPSCRFVLLTAEPGCGKTALAAWLARQHPDWLRYFIRRDQISPLGPPTARALLMQIGFQLAALQPNLFTPEGIKIRVEQRVTSAAPDSRITAAEVERLIASPFIQGAIQIRQDVERLEGELTGLRVAEWIAEPRLIPVDDLQYLALLDPAAAREPEAVVILIDALDELRYHPCEQDVLQWLETLPELPPNLRFILTSRPDDALLRGLRDRQGAQLREIAVRTEQPEMRAALDRDVQAYARQWLTQPEVARALENNVEPVDRPAAFVEALVRRADGNLGYVVALGRAFDQAVARQDVARQTALVRLSDLPASLQDLYAFFLHQLKARVRDTTVEVQDPATRQRSRAAVWSAVYRPLLGALCIAVEPVTPDQLWRLGDFAVDLGDLIEALLELQQFLDTMDGRHRFHHATVSEFLTAASTLSNAATQDLFVDSARAHARALTGHQRQVGGWQQPRWSQLDAYGWNHLTLHAQRADPEGATLLELAKAGFLPAKQRQFASAAVLEEDWARLFSVVRSPSRLLDFVTFGDKRSTGAIRSHVLQNGSAARAAVRIALQTADSAELRRILGEIGIIQPLEVRLQLEFGLHQLLTGSPAAAEEATALQKKLQATIASMSEGAERDLWAARLAIAVLDGAAPDGERAQEVTGRLTPLARKVELTCTLATKYAAAPKSQAKAKAAPLLHQLLDEIAATPFSEDIAADVLQFVLHQARVSPAEALHALLLDIIPVAGRVDAAQSVAILQRICEQSIRISGLAKVGPADPATLAIAITQALQTSGARHLAHGCAKSLLARFGVAPDQATSEPAGEGIPGWDQLLQNLRPAGLRPLVTCAVILPIVDDPTTTHTWAQSVVAGLAEATFETWLQVTGDLWQMAEMSAAPQAALRQALSQLMERLPPAALPFELTCVLAATAGCLGETQTARELIGRVLQSMSGKTIGRAEYPNQAQAYRWSFGALWAALCRLNDASLAKSGLEWLFNTAEEVLPPDLRAQLTAGLFASLEHVTDPQLAQHLHQRLAEAIAQSFDRTRFFSVALTQFADAYAALGRRETAGRCLGEAENLAGTVGHPQFIADILCRAAPLWAEILKPDVARAAALRALEMVPHIQGLNHQAGVLASVVHAVIPAAKSPEFRALAGDVLAKAFECAERISSFEINSMTCVVEGFNRSGLPCPPKLAARLSQRLLRPEDQGGGKRSSSNRTITAEQAGEQVRAASALQTAGARDASRAIVDRIEQAVDQLPSESESNRVQLCQIWHLSGMFEELPWRPLPGNASHASAAAALALSIQTPELRSDACVAAARIAAHAQDAAEAARLLTSAIDAWHRIGEWLWARQRVGGLFKAFAEIPDRSIRAGCLRAMLGVVRRHEDFYERERAMAHLTIAWADDPDQCRTLGRSILLPTGLDRILAAAHDGNLSGDFVRDLILDVLEKSTRLVPACFLGHSLLVGQISARRSFHDANAISATLDFIERRMRDLLGIPAD